MNTTRRAALNAPANRSEYAANVELHHAAFARRDLQRIRASVARGNANSLQGIRDAWQARREREARRERLARLAWWVIGSAILPAIFLIATN